MLKLLCSNTCIYCIFYFKGSLYLTINQTAARPLEGKLIYKEHGEGYIIFFSSFLQCLMRIDWFRDIFCSFLQSMPWEWFVKTVMRNTFSVLHYCDLYLLLYIWLTDPPQLWSTSFRRWKNTWSRYISHWITAEKFTITLYV